MALCKRLSGTSESVKSCLIFGCLWDATLEYLVKSENKTYSEIGVDSSSWANYPSLIFTYIDLSGNEVEKSSSKLIPTGSTEYTNSCNIYDLAGNVWEWIQEINGSSSNPYIYIGGAYSSGYYKTSNYRYSIGSPNRNNVDNGCRAILYVK